MSANLPTLRVEMTLADLRTLVDLMDHVESGVFPAVDGLRSILSVGEERVFNFNLRPSPGYLTELRGGFGEGDEWDGLGE